MDIVIFCGPCNPGQCRNEHQNNVMGAGCCGSHINICSLRNEVLHHICLTKVCSIVQRLPPTFQGPVYIFSLQKGKKSTLTGLK